MLSSPFTYMPDPAPQNAAPAPAAANGAPPPATKTKPSLFQSLKDNNAGYKKLWPYVDKYRWQFVASILAGAGSAAFTAAQLKVVQLVTKHSFSEGSSAATTAAPMLGHVMLICSLLPLVMMARCLCDYLETYYMTWVSLRVMHDLRVKIFNHLLGQSSSFSTSPRSVALSPASPTTPAPPSLPSPPSPTIS